MIYTPAQYKRIYFDNRVSTKTVIRRCRTGLIHSDHIVHELGRYMIIEVPTKYRIKRKS